MRITVKLYADLREYSNGERTLTLEFTRGSRVMDVLERLKIPEREIKIIMVNCRRAKPNNGIHDGDRVAIFPPIAGG